MKNIRVWLAAAVLACTALVGVAATTSPASAVTCGDKVFYSSTTAWVDGDNLKVAGRPLKWDFSLSKRECSDGDHIADVRGVLHKDGTGCAGLFGTNRGYKFNPNSLGGVNSGERELDCLANATVYTALFSAYDGVVLTPGMSSEARCLNFTFAVDVLAQADPTYSNASPICFNGS